MPDATSLTARTSTGWSAPSSTSAGGSAGAARPVRWLGAEAVGGLQLPDASPAAGRLYAPRGVWLDDRCLVACDSGNHRVLVWHGDPVGASHTDADVVLGQPGFGSEGAQAAGRGPERGMRLPTGVIVVDGRLVVADAWNHRLLVWDEVPTTSDRAPDLVVGQPDASSVDENRSGPCGPHGFWWPFGLAFADGLLWVADTGNRRVLAYDGIPEPGQSPVVVLGQPDAHSREENRGEVGPASFRWPHAIAAAGDVLFVADAGNHRLLLWQPHPRADAPASAVLGQPDFETAVEFPYQEQSPASLRFPYAVAVDHTDPDRPMAVADTANNRVLLWDSAPSASRVPADRVLGQPDFGTNGENRWSAVEADTFCWPYGLSFHRGLLAVADSGNNRVTVWDVR